MILSDYGNGGPLSGSHPAVPSPGPELEDRRRHPVLLEIEAGNCLRNLDMVLRLMNSGES